MAATSSALVGCGCRKSGECPEASPPRDKRDWLPEPALVGAMPAPRDGFRA